MLRQCEAKHCRSVISEKTAGDSPAVILYLIVLVQHPDDAVFPVHAAANHLVKQGPGTVRETGLALEQDGIPDREMDKHPAQNAVPELSEGAHKRSSPGLKGGAKKLASLRRAALRTYRFMQSLR